MGKRTRKEKKEEERRVVEEMQAALAESKRAEREDCEENAESEDSGNVSSAGSRRARGAYDSTPERIHCRRCRTVMENGVCPTCGFKVYVPMDEKKRNKIRLIATVVIMTVFVIVFVLLQVRKS